MLFATVGVLALILAVLARRHQYVTSRLSTSASTLLTFMGAYGAGSWFVMVLDSPWRWITALPIAVAGALLLLWIGAQVNDRWIRPARLRAEERRGRPTVLQRLETFADTHTPNVGRVNIVAAIIATGRRSGEVRVTGLAAEMTYYGLISLMPLITAVGASLGFLERFIGQQDVAQIEQTVVDGVAQIFSDQVAEDVMAPLVESLLHQERTGVAVGSILVALWLASRVFRAAVRALDEAYEVTRRRNIISQTVLGLALVIGAVATFVALIGLVVIGPLLGSAAEIADRFGLGTFFELAWGFVRWPTVALIAITYLTLLYRFGPNTHSRWRDCLPGAFVGAIGVVGVAAVLAVYVSTAGPQTPDVDAADSEVVTVAAQIIGVILAGVLWLWLTSIALLVGGVFNAEIERQKNGLRSDGKARDDGDEPDGDADADAEWADERS